MNGGQIMPHPDVRLSWSASSLSAYDKCPFSYWLFKVLRIHNMRPKRTLIWGHAFHDFVQAFEIERAGGFTPDLFNLLHVALNTCKAKGFEDAYVAKVDINQRGLISLIRACTLYYDTHLNDNFKVCKLTDNNFAVEVPLEFQLPFTTKDNIPFTMSGFLDLVVSDITDPPDNIVLYPREMKTTKTDGFFYAQHYLRPSIQMRTYDYIAYEYARQHNCSYQGISTLVVQLLSDSCRIYEDIIKYTPHEREWYIEWLGRVLKRHEYEAEQGWLSFENMINTPYVRSSGITHRDDTDNGEINTHSILMLSPQERLQWVKLHAPQDIITGCINCN